MPRLVGLLRILDAQWKTTDGDMAHGTPRVRATKGTNGEVRGMVTNQGVINHAQGTHRMWSSTYGMPMGSNP